MPLPHLTRQPANLKSHPLMSVDPASAGGSLYQCTELYIILKKQRTTKRSSEMHSTMISPFLKVANKLKQIRNVLEAVETFLNGTYVPGKSKPVGFILFTTDSCPIKL